MSDRCRGWRELLSRQADSALTRAQQRGLEDHLAHCSACRDAYEADSALRNVLGIHTGLLDRRHAQTFDERVLAELRATPPLDGPPTGVWGMWQRFRTRWEELRISLAAQIVGGALVAAACTAFVLLPTLPPATTAPATEKERTALTRNEPPVALETLLETPTPRAAMLWTTPVPSDAHPRPAAQSSKLKQN